MKTPKYILFFFLVSVFLTSCFLSKKNACDCPNFGTTSVKKSTTNS